MTKTGKERMRQRVNQEEIDTCKDKTGSTESTLTLIGNISAGSPARLTSVVLFATLAGAGHSVAPTARADDPAFRSATLAFHSMISVPLPAPRHYISQC